MYELTVESNFSAAHFLRGYDGPCKNLHGHNWKVILTIRVVRLDDIGIGIDFRDLKKELSAVLEQLDHRNLNDVSPFTTLNPTAENLSKWVFETLGKKINDGNVNVYSVKIWESESASALYRVSS